MIYSTYSPKILIELRTYVLTYLRTYSNEIPYLKPNIGKIAIQYEMRRTYVRNKVTQNTKDEAEQAYGRDQSLKLCREFDVSQKAEAMMRT